MAQRLNNLPAMQETRVSSLGSENPLEMGWQFTPVFLPGECHGQRSLVVTQVHKEADMTEWPTLSLHFQSKTKCTKQALQSFKYELFISSKYQQTHPIPWLFFLFEGFFFINCYWSIVVSQRCVHLYCTAKRICHTYTFHMSSAVWTSSQSAHHRALSRVPCATQ